VADAARPRGYFIAHRTVCARYPGGVAAEQREGRSASNRGVFYVDRMFSAGWCRSGQILRTS
jgi:hypothetical protein